MRFVVAPYMPLGVVAGQARVGSRYLCVPVLAQAVSVLRAVVPRGWSMVAVVVFRVPTRLLPGYHPTLPTYC
jgi:hypothetical protein